MPVLGQLRCCSQAQRVFDFAARHKSALKRHRKVANPERRIAITPARPDHSLPRGVGSVPAHRLPWRHSRCLDHVQYQIHHERDVVGDAWLRLGHAFPWFPVCGCNGRNLRLRAVTARDPRLPRRRRQSGRGVGQAIGPKGPAIGLSGWFGVLFSVRSTFEMPRMHGLESHQNDRHKAAMASQPIQSPLVHSYFELLPPLE